jgi:hypothetical protein
VRKQRHARRLNNLPNFGIQTLVDFLLGPCLCFDPVAFVATFSRAVREFDQWEKGETDFEKFEIELHPVSCGQWEAIQDI